jgi:hypothetical protein
MDTHLRGLILAYSSTSVSEFMCYVALAHTYMDRIHPNGDIGPGGDQAREDDHGMLHRVTKVLSEALGLRNQRFPPYPGIAIDLDRREFSDIVAANTPETVQEAQAVLSQPFGIDPANTNCLIWAARKGNIPVIDLLLAAGADVNYCSWLTSLSWASAYARPRACSRLLRAGGPGRT